MTELTWLMVGIWAFLLTIFAVFKKTFWGGSAGALGSFLGVSLLTDSLPLGFIFIIINIYLLYASLTRNK